jgi:hypothetical protein
LPSTFAYSKISVRCTHTNTHQKNLTRTILICLHAIKKWGGALAPHIPNPHSQALQIAFTQCSSENMNSNFFSLPLVLSDCLQHYDDDDDDDDDCKCHFTSYVNQGRQKGLPE